MATPSTISRAKWEPRLGTQFKLTLQCWNDCKMKRLTVERETSEGETFPEFRGFGAIREVFSAKFGGVAFFGAAKVSNSRKFSPSKFPAIRYHTYQSAVGDKPCQGNKLLNSKFKDPYAVTVTKGKLIVGGFPKKNFALCSVLVDKRVNSLSLDTRLDGNVLRFL